MAIKRYYVDGADSSHTLWDTTAATNQTRLKNTEQGLGKPPRRNVIEKTPNLYADRYRLSLYDPRLVTAEYDLVPTTQTQAGLDALVGNWEDWHNSRLGLGYLKFVTPAGNTRDLDCIPELPEWGEQIGFTKRVTQKYTAPNPFFRSDTQSSANADANASVTVNNPGFETFTGTQDDGTSDTFGNWTAASVNDGAGDKCEATATAQADTYAVKLTYTAGQPTLKTDNIGVTAGEELTLSFYTRGDATEQGQYLVYDVTNSADIVAATNTGVNGTSYAEVSKTFDVPAGCANIYIQLLAPDSAGTAYFDAVTLIRSGRLLSCAVTGDVASWCTITVTGVCTNPKVTNSDGDYIEIDATATNADDEIVIDTRPGFRGAKYYEHGTGDGVPLVRTDSTSKFITLATGTNSVTIAAETGTPNIKVEWYQYYEDLN